ncbi:acetylglutamate kinase [Streptomyces aurantiogriseus]|uniref:acetylglutamate kinase n=1 Tax=Streptomyces aurantiogriseus TaxID=66870 RepID=A0A918FLQ8_9ACTN|nr:acetylglutamate kinase [Streptomyces aurantiogriseus]GGR52164.1 acetylglutamate kinase [Streptomyces aurantiogriseus]
MNRAPAEGVRSLVDALAWLAPRRGRTVVVAVTGRALDDTALGASFADDVAFLWCAGLRLVVVHGDGPHLGAELERRGLDGEHLGAEPRSRGPAGESAAAAAQGRAAADVVRMVLAGRVQRDLVGLINRHGPLAFGLTGEDGTVLTAVRDTAAPGSTPGGRITRVRPGLVRTLLADGRVPVVSPIAYAAEGGPGHRVDAGAAAGALAGALGADALVLLTDGLEGAPAGRLTARQGEKLLPDLSGAAAAALACCLAAVRAGAGAAHLVHAWAAHALLTEIATEHGTGTVVLPDADDAAGQRSGAHCHH